MSEAVPSKSSMHDELASFSSLRLEALAVCALADLEGSPVPAAPRSLRS
jgi:hypothetical protein